MAKPRFASLRSIITLFTRARSTEWPGPSHCAIYLPFFCLVIAVAQLGVNAALGSKLLHIGAQVACREPGRIRMTWLPVTYALEGGSGTNMRAKMSMQENQSKAEILFTAILTPLAIVILLLSLFMLHLRRLSNRCAMLMAFLLLSLFMIANAQDTWLRIDSRRVHNEYRLCYKTGPEMDTLWEARHTRWQLLIAGEVLSGLGSLLVVFYIVLAITAASLNRARVRAPQPSTTRLQNLPSDDSLPEAPLILPPPQLRLRPLSPVHSISFEDKTDSETEAPEAPKPPSKPYKTKIEEAEKRIKEYREANLGRTASDPLAEAEGGLAGQGDLVQDPETGKWRKDSGREL